MTLLLRKRYRTDATPHVIGLYRNGNGITYELLCDHHDVDSEARLFRITAVEERRGSMRWRNDLSGTFTSLDDLREAVRLLDEARPLYDLEDLRYRYLDVAPLPYQGQCEVAYMRVDRHRILALAAHRHETRYTVTVINTMTKDVERTSEHASYDDAIECALRYFDTFTRPNTKPQP
ncbi:MAG: hypothetical protein D6683_01555 [Actinomyces sp.]|nr:MAG: hypothetical protein D6683_01555 [Actinomyces sp.]